MTPSMTATTGMDALTHAVEAYIGRSTTAATRYAAQEANPLYPVPRLMDAGELETFYYKAAERRIPWKPTMLKPSWTANAGTL